MNLSINRNFDGPQLQTKKQNVNFGMFRATDENVLKGIKKLTDIWPLNDLANTESVRLQSGSEIDNIRDFICRLVTPKQIDKLRLNKDVYVTKSDLLGITQCRPYYRRGDMYKYLQQEVAVANTKTIEQVDEVLPEFEKSNAHTKDLRDRALRILDLG